MSTQFYHHEFSIPDLNFVARNAIALSPNFHAFVCGPFESNIEGETSSIALTFPIGTFDAAVLDNIASKAYTATVTAYKSDPNAADVVDWTFTGIISLTAINLQVGTPLRPVGSGEAPGVVPFRSLRSDQAGKLPITGR
jgi:hypothetical protein